MAALPELDVAGPGMWMLPSWVRWDETGRLVALAADRATDLDDHRSTVWRAGVATLVQAAELGQEALLLDAAQALAVAHEQRDLAEFDAGGRDLPARQRLQQVARAAATAVRLRHTAAPTARAVSAVLAEHALLADLAVEPALESVPWADPDGAFEVLSDIAALSARAPVLDVAVQLISTRAWARLAGEDPVSVLGIVRRLATDPRSEAARLGLALLELQGDEQGWDDDRRAVLRDLRRHHDPMLRLAAVRVLTANE